MTDMIDRLVNFVENGGRLHKGEEPKYGQPFYGDYMKQYISAHYNLGDRVKVTTDRQVYEGMILTIGFRFNLLMSGRKVHKDKRNKKEIRYEEIQTIELIKEKDNLFDLAVVDPDEWKWQNEKDDNLMFSHKKTEHSKNKRHRDCEEFHKVYPEVDFDKSHIIKINDGCRLYWPFNHNGITAEVFMVRDEDKITPVPCKTGTPFPNKNSYHAYNCKPKDSYPDLYMYLPDNGFCYEDVNIVCVWTINTTVAEKNSVIKVINIHHVGKIKPVKDERNMIFVDMSVLPLLGYGNSLFNETRSSSLLTSMMNRDLYIVFDLKNDAGLAVKSPEDLEEDEMDKYFLMSAMAISNFDLQEVVCRITRSQEECSPLVEVFCNIDHEPERYYSSAWRHCRKEYEFKMLSSTLD